MPSRAPARLALAVAAFALATACLALLARSPATRPQAALLALAAAAATPLLLARSSPRGPRPISPVEAMMQVAPEAILIARKDGQILLSNARAEALFGCPRRELLALRLENVLRPTRLVPAGESDSSIIAVTRAKARPGDLFTVRKPDGQELLVEMSVAPLTTPEEGPVLIALLRDVTERRRAEQLASARRMVRRLLAEARSMDEAAPRVLRCLGEKLGWHRALLWEPRDGAVSITASWQAPEWADLGNGRPWQDCPPVLEESRRPDRLAAHDAPLRAGVGQRPGRRRRAALPRAAAGR